MNQLIKFKRGSNTYTSYSAAVNALNGVTHAVGQPVVVYYKDSSEATEVKVLLAVGIDDGVGPDKYKSFSSDVQADWDETTDTSPSYIKNKPTIPTVNDATFTIKSKIGNSTTSIADFTANQASNDDFTIIQGDNVTLTNDTSNRTITVDAYYSSFYGTSSTSAETSSKTSTINGYVLKAGGLVSIKFTEQVNASATLNINNGTSDTGAKAIYYNNGAITDGIIKSGDVATFIYDGTYYQLLSINTASVGSVFGGSGTNHKSGAVPDPGSTAGTTKFLREDGSWQVPPGGETVNDGELSINMKVGSTVTEVSDFTANQASNDSFTLEQGNNVSLTSTSTGTITVAASNSATLQVSDTINKKINTTETTGNYIQFTGGTNKFTVSDGTNSFDVGVTPSISDNVTGSGLTSDKVILGNGGSSVKTSSIEITTTAPTSSSDDTTIPTSKAVKSAIDNGIAINGAMIYKGTIAGGDTGSYGSLTGAANRGWTYKVSTAGKIDGISVEVGDMIICNTDNTAEATDSNYSTIVNNWDFLQANIDGAVIGPSSSTDSHVVVFDGGTGKIVKDSSYTIGKSIPSDAVFTDREVSSSSYHYTPQTLATTGDIVGTISGTAGSYAIDTEYTVLTGVSATTDGKGHVTGISYTAQKVKDTNTTYSSLSASPGGTDVSLVTTGEKSTWNNKQSSVSQLGSTTKPVYTSSAGTFAECNDYAGGTAITLNGTSKAATTASFYAPTSYGTSGYYLKANGQNSAPTWTQFPTIPSRMSDVSTITVSAVTANTTSSCSITGSENSGKSETIIYTNSSGSDYTVTVPTTYATPDGNAIELTCPNGGYCEVNYLNMSGTIYARGL